MIEKIHGMYIGSCDICGEETELFDDWYAYKDWIKENWKIKFDKDRQEWQHLCSNCGTKMDKEMTEVQ